MSRKIFVNLPVKNLDKSMTFFEGLGFSFNRQFTDETAACMVISNDIYAMLLTHDKFKEFSPNGVCNSKKTNEVLVSLSCESQEDVDATVAKAVAAGGKNSYGPQNHGFMYIRSFQDLDGHVWELLWMDPAFVKQQS